MQCPHCGKEVGKDSKFCKNCGGALEDSETSKKSSEETLEKEVSTKEVKEVEKPKKNKKIVLIVVILVIILLLIAVGMFLWFGNMSNKKKPGKTEEVSETKKEKSYLEKYQDYFEDNDLLDEDDIEGVLIDFKDDEEPELVMKYLDDSKQDTLKILSIHGDKVRESSEYPLYFLSMLYNVEKEKYEYYIETKVDDGVEYLSILDIISEKSDISKLKDIDEEREYDADDEEFNYQYIKPNITVDMYTISKSSLKSDLKRLDKKYKEEKGYVSSDEEERVKEESQKIKDNTLKKDNTGISNQNYKIQYGTYTYGSYSFTLNSNNSATYKYNSVGAGFELGGSLTLFYDQILFVGSGSKKAFKVIGNNQLQSIDEGELNNAIWNLQ